MGYIDYYDTKELQERASTMDSSVTVDANDTNKAIYEKYINQLGRRLDVRCILRKWVNSMLRVKFQFLNVFSNSIPT